MSSIAAKLSKAVELKEDGNNFFKEGNFSRAKSSYGKCLAYITGIPGSKRNQTGWENFAPQLQETETASDAEESAAAELEKVIHQNLAACYLKMENPQKAVVHANKALALDGTAWKAMLRKGEAYMMSGGYDEAKEVLQQALQNVTDPAHEAAVKREQAKLAKLLKIFKENEKKRFAGMFSKDSATTSNP